MSRTYRRQKGHRFWLTRQYIQGIIEDQVAIDRHRIETDKYNWHWSMTAGVKEKSNRVMRASERNTLKGLMFIEDYTDAHYLVGKCEEQTTGAIRHFT